MELADFVENSADSAHSVEFAVEFAAEYSAVAPERSRIAA